MTQHDALLQQLEEDTAPKVYCADCEFFQRGMTLEGHACHHPHALYQVSTPTALVSKRYSAEERNAQNHCPDFTPVVSQWRRDLRYNPDHCRNKQIFFRLAPVALALCLLWWGYKWLFS
jgi:hypothetical protein